MHRALSTYASSTPRDAENDLLRQYGGLVDRVARRIAMRTGNPGLADDLWSAGAEGLLEASRKFDPTRAVSFETFAEQRVRGAMLDELRRMDHLPRRLRTQSNDVQAARRRLSTALGREPSVEELAADQEMSVEELGELETVGAPHVQLDWALALVGDRDDDPLARIDLGRRMTAAITALPERLQILLGLVYTEDLTYAEIATLLEISKPRVCQLHADAIQHLRTSMGV